MKKIQLSQNLHLADRLILFLAAVMFANEILDLARPHVQSNAFDRIYDRTFFLLISVIWIVVASLRLRVDRLGVLLYPAAAISFAIGIYSALNGLNTMTRSSVGLAVVLQVPLLFLPPRVERNSVSLRDSAEPTQ